MQGPIYLTPRLTSRSERPRSRGVKGGSQPTSDTLWLARLIPPTHVYTYLAEIYALSQSCCPACLTSLSMLSHVQCRHECHNVIMALRPSVPSCPSRRAEDDKPRLLPSSKDLRAGRNLTCAVHSKKDWTDPTRDKISFRQTRGWRAAA